MKPIRGEVPKFTFIGYNYGVIDYGCSTENGGYSEGYDEKDEADDLTGLSDGYGDLWDNDRNAYDAFGDGWGFGTGYGFSDNNGNGAAKDVDARKLDPLTVLALEVLT